MNPTPKEFACPTREKEIVRWSLFSLAAIQIYSLAMLQIITAASILVISIIWFAQHRQPIFNRDLIPLAYAVLAFIILRLAGYFWSPYNTAAVRAMQFPLMTPVFFAIAIGIAMLSRQDREHFRQVWLVAAAVAAAVGIAKYALGVESRIGPPFTPHHPMADRPPEGNYSTFAEFLAMTLLAFVPISMGTVSRGWKRWNWALLCLVAVALILTFSRSCLLAAALVLGIFAFRRRPRLLWIIPLAVAALLLLPYGRQRVAETLSPEKWTSGRGQLWRIAAEHLAERPFFGFGPGSFPLLVTPDARSKLPDPGVGDWHNQYLQLYMEYGLAGLLAFAGVVGIGLRYFIRWLRPDRAENRSAAAGGIALLGGMLIVGLFEQFLGSPSGNIVFWALFGFTAGTIAVGPREPAS